MDGPVDRILFRLVPFVTFQCHQQGDRQDNRANIETNKDRHMYDLNSKRISPAEMLRTRDLTPAASRLAGMAAVPREPRLQVRCQGSGELELRMIDPAMPQGIAA